jgi:hypothetical protein
MLLVVLAEHFWANPLLPIAATTIEIIDTTSTRFCVCLAKLIQIASKEIVQEGSDHGDGTNLADLLPCWSTASGSVPR